MKTKTLTDTKTGARWRIGPGGVDILPPLAPVSLAVQIAVSNKTKQQGPWTHTVTTVQVQLVDRPTRAVLRSFPCGFGRWHATLTPRCKLAKAYALAEKVAADWRREWLGIEPEARP